MHHQPYSYQMPAICMFKALSAADLHPWSSPSTSEWPRCNYFRESIAGCDVCLIHHLFLVNEDAIMASNGAGKFSFSFGGVTGPSKSPGAAATAQPAPMSNMDLLLAKAKAPPSTTTSQAKKPIRFDDEDEDDGPAQAQPVASSSKPKPPRPKPSLLDGPPAPAPSHVKQTTSMSRAEKRLQSEALALDSTAFQYDEVYDNLKAAERKVEQAKKQDTSERKSKYMESFLESARRRKLDQLHAEEKMMQIEREKEGGEFDDKEKFVTSAYKAQMEEVRKAEEEERKKEGEWASSRQIGSRLFTR